MSDKNEYNSKRNTVINVCLEQFVDKGLYGTTSRDLSKALNLQSAGMYSYFENKDDAIVACAEQAALKLETALSRIALKNISDPFLMVLKLKNKAIEMAPMMRFFTQVCSTEKYECKIRPLLSKLSTRYEKYAKEIAIQLNVDAENINYIVYMTITAIVNYMVYQEESYINPQLQFVAEQISKIIEQ